MKSALYNECIEFCKHHGHDPIPDSTVSDLEKIKFVRQSMWIINKAVVDVYSFETLEHGILLNRIYAADLMAFVCRVAWECRLAGDHILWNQLKYIDKYKECLNAFEVIAEEDFRSLRNGDAMRGTFDIFFLQEKNIYDLDNTWVESALKNESVFTCDLQPPKQHINEIISNLGQMVGINNNYLSSRISEITTDIVFTELRCRSHSNFVWFIKFERSFKQQNKNQDGNSPPSNNVVQIPKNTKIDKNPLGEVLCFQDKSLLSDKAINW